MEEPTFVVSYPINIKKYGGSIQRKRSGRYMVRFSYNNLYYKNTVDTNDEAENIIKTYAIQYEHVKNIVHVYENHLKVLCEGDKYFICDIDDRDLVEEHTWHLSKGYAGTFDNRRFIFFHNLKMNFVPTDELTIDHCDGNPINNRRENLRIFNRMGQRINAKIRKNNRTGIRGVSFETPRDRYVCRWIDPYSNKYKKSFSCKKYGYDGAKRLAEDMRKRLEEELPHYKEALKGRK
jgi:hypothetical protein